MQYGVYGASFETRRGKMTMPRAPSVRWSREHLLVALNLYCKLPFGSFDKSNPVIKEVAGRLGRSPSSLSMKLCNFASLDPVQQARGIRGLQGASAQDKSIWSEFHAGANELAPESESLLHDLFTDDERAEVELRRGAGVRLIRPARPAAPPAGPTEGRSTVKVRRGQQFFRQSVLNVYGSRCCISGINVPRFLVASHIKPWSRFPAERLNPRNGLCLSSIHDAAFDDGLITLDADCRVVLSRDLRSYFPQKALEDNFVPYEGKKIASAEKLAEPDPAFLDYHREAIFEKRNR